MELKISVTEKYNSASSNQTSLQSQQSVCVVSCENVVAFTKVLYRSNSFKQSIPVYTVYAADLNTPFETHVIMESLDQILKMKFSNDGQNLIIVTNLKDLHLYVKGAGLDHWTNSLTLNWCEEKILCVNFFHNRNKPSIQTNDIKVNAPYSEKFHCRLHQPSLRSIGNCPQNGIFAVTASGLFLACTINSNGVMEEEEKAVLGPFRDNFVLATASFAQDGHICIAAWKPDIVKVWNIELSYTESGRIATQNGTIFGGISINGNRKLKIAVQSANFFSPAPLCTDETTKTKSVKVTHIKYMDQEDPNSLILFIEEEKAEAFDNRDKQSELSQNQLLAAKEETDHRKQRYILQRYLLQDKARPLFQFFLQPPTSDKSSATMTIKEWVCQAEWTTMYPILALSIPMQNMISSYNIPYVITVASSDCCIYAINKETMQMISKYSFQSRTDDISSSKRNCKDKLIISLAPTWTNLHLVALDSGGGLHVLSLLRQNEIGSTWLVYLMLMLEYSLVSGYDSWDILVAAPISSALTLADRLSETFHQHPPKVVANLISKFLVLKNAIMRLSSNLQMKSIECRLQAQLSAILKLFHALRPVTTDVVNMEKNCAATIQTYIESRSSLEITDIDKSIDNLLFSYNILDCQVDPTLSQDVQILLEFSIDLSLYLLLLLVQNPKYELAKEPKILQYLREILFVARIWFRHNKLVLPQVIKKTDAIDIWAQLYKLLTRLAQIIPNEPDAGFLDDCINLETQVLCREVPLFIPSRGVFGCISSSSLSTTHFPLQFHYDQPDQNPSVSSVNPRPLEGSLAPPLPLDPLYYHFLGSGRPLFQCTRCFALRGTWWGANELSLWEQEWTNRCICSGHWAPTPAQNHHNKSGAGQGGKVYFLFEKGY